VGRANGIAPYFIDGDGTENPAKLPIGGLTRISFPNNHMPYAMPYALTWFGMAALTLLAGWIVLRPCKQSSSDD
jgi:surfeit locus 1 family protein